jgi:S-adenosylmethionine-diacylglycerol 3-amino-3-carboxypropyl transferase
MEPAGSGARLLSFLWASRGRWDEIFPAHFPCDEAVMKLSDWFSSTCFNMVHQKNLVYNTCWEDPRLDHVALQLSPDDNVLVITSAGCNALDYVLKAPKHVYAVDMNPRQNALLQLKQAAIRHLDYNTFFSMFGKGRLPDYHTTYASKLRPDLSPQARVYWDKYITFFSGTGWWKSFYFHGTSGTVARLVNTYIDRIAKVRHGVEEILNAPNVEEQKRIYDEWLGEAFWNRFVRWAVARDTSLSMLGVPKPQRQHLENHYEGGISKFIEDCIEAVFTKLPLRDNYFWRVYLTGQYTPECCPEYLKRENFDKLKGGLINRVTTHTSSILDFLNHHHGTISRYVLLDHMDWLSTFRYPILEQEWQAILDKSAPKTRILWRSGGLQTEFVDRVKVTHHGHQGLVGEVLKYDRPLAEELHPRDRVHTYGSFHIADVAM